MSGQAVERAKGLAALASGGRSNPSSPGYRPSPTAQSLSHPSPVILHGSLSGHFWTLGSLSPRPRTSHDVSRKTSHIRLARVYMASSVLTFRVKFWVAVVHSTSVWASQESVKGRLTKRGPRFLGSGLVMPATDNCSVPKSRALSRQGQANAPFSLQGFGP